MSSREDKINLSESFYAIRTRNSNGVMEWRVFKKFSLNNHAKGGTLEEAYLNTIKLIEEEITEKQNSRESLVQNYKNLKAEEIL